METNRNWISEFESICSNCHQGNNEILTYLYVICDYLIENERNKEIIEKEEPIIINNKEDDVPIIEKKPTNGKKK